MSTTTTNNAAGNTVLVGLSNGANEPENVLIAYLMGVEALRAGKRAAMWLTKDGVNVATVGFAATIEVDGAPSISALHDEYIAEGGQFFVCPVCVKVRDLGSASWVPNAEVKGAPSVYEFTEGGAIVFNY